MGNTQDTRVVSLRLPMPLYMALKTEANAIGVQGTGTYIRMLLLDHAKQEQATQQISGSERTEVP